MQQNPTSLCEKWGIDIQPMLPSAKGLRIAERNHLNYAISPAEMQQLLNLIKSLSSLAEITEFSENQDFLMIHKRLLTLPLWGLQSRYAGLCMGKVLKRKKKNEFFFP
jgi:hypothetical protein